eukprot:364582-Chlamydomonas_euryale.AAC.2
MSCRGEGGGPHRPLHCCCATLSDQLNLHLNPLFCWGFCNSYGMHAVHNPGKQASAKSDAAARREKLKAIKADADAELERLDVVAALKQLASQSQAQTAILNKMAALLQKLQKDQLEHNRSSRLQAALANAEASAFKCRMHGSWTTSAAFVREVLLSFMQGYGCYIDNEYVVSEADYYVSGDWEEQGREAFREALVDQIHQLTGMEPGMEEPDTSSTEDRWTIYRDK